MRILAKLAIISFSLCCFAGGEGDSCPSHNTEDCGKASNDSAKIMEKLQTAEKNVATQDSVNEDFRLALGADYNWEHLLSPAPLGIAILGNLMFMAGSMKDYPIDAEVPKDGFKYIQYPKSFRTSLVQISHAGYRAFKTAHVNMDKIRLHTLNVPGYMQAATKALVSKNPEVIKAFLPDQLKNILEVSDECSRLSTEVVEDFDGVINLTMEVIAATVSTKSKAEQVYVKASQAINETKWKAELTKTLIDNLRLEKEKAEKSIDEANAAVREAAAKTPTLFETVAAKAFLTAMDLLTFQLMSAQPRPKMQTTFDDCSRKEYPIIDEELEILVKNSRYVFQVHTLGKSLVDLLDNTDNLNSIKNGKFNCDEEIETLKGIQKTVRGSEQLYEVCSRGIQLLQELQNVAENAQGVVDDSLRHKAAEFFRKANELKQRAMKYTPPVRPQTPGGSSRKPDMSGDAIDQAVQSARYNSENAMEQLRMAREAADKTREIMMKKNEEHIELLVKMQHLNFEKDNHEEAIQLLHEGLVHLTELKEHWSQLVIFFRRIANIVEITLSKGLNNFNQIVDKSSKTPELMSYAIDQIYGHAFKANQAAYMVYCMSDTYGKVSSAYIMDSITQLDRLMIVDKNNRLALEARRDELTASCKKASKEIIRMVDKDKKEMIEKIVARMGQVEREYAFLKELPAKPVLTQQAPPSMNHVDAGEL